MSGWIKLYRDSLNHWLYQSKYPRTRREAWEDILMLVNYEDKKVLIRGQLYECKRGQAVYSLETWASLFNWSKQQVRTFFVLLKNDKMIELEGLQYTTRLTVCNYDIYQSEQHTNNTPITHEQHSANTPLTPTKEGKKEKEINISFETFWNLYNKKQDRVKCETKWRRLTNKEREACIEAIPAYVKSTPDVQYRKNPATYLNNKSWENEVSPAVPIAAPRAIPDYINPNWVDDRICKR